MLPATDAADGWAAGMRRMATAERADVSGTVAGLWAFADRFAAVVGRDTNTVFSPASLGYAFGMLRGGAGGPTARQLDAIFRFPSTVHDAFAAMRRDIVTTDKPPSAGSKRAQVAIANGLFVLPQLRLDARYLRLMADTYGAKAQPVDLGSPEALEILDAWVAEQTAGRIDTLFDRLAPDTIAVLANAVYLKAFWRTQFDAGTTADAPFHRTGGASVPVPMMRIPKPEPLPYARHRDWHAVQLPYEGGELAMWVIVPTTSHRPPRITAATLDTLGRAKPRSVDVYLPRWDITQKIDLLPGLRRLGFTTLNDLPAFPRGAFVDQAIHRANITVDESGTEAAAVTGIAIRQSASQVDQTLRADRPFTYAVVHTPTATPLFVGTVQDPSHRDVVR